MVTPTQAARDYLLPPSDAFWQWWEDGEVLAWAHGKTISFRQELLSILEALAPGGLPPLGAVALLLSASRDNWREWDTESVTLEEALDSLPDSEYARELLQRVLHGLDQVHQLPPDVRTTLDGRTVLAEIVFEGASQRLSPTASREALALLSDGIQEELVHQLFGDSAAQLLEDLKCLAGGVDRIAEETVRNRLRTGMDSLPVAADEVSVPDQVRSLLVDLQSDSQLAALATLATQLLAAISLPRQISQPDELPIGGVSDISNRGSLDRLLLSELANDDLTLSVRLAMNEALYLRRETPRRTQPQRRSVLLEAGIRSWGLPRVFSTAVGLALAAAANPHETSEVFRASGASLAEVDFTTREGLMQHLESLDLELHPGLAWPLFCERALGESTADPILVATAEAVADPEFQEVLKNNPLQNFLVATVDRAGEFHLFVRSARGSKTLRKARLDLGELLDSPNSATALRDDDWVRQLPKVFAQVRFPLRLSHNLVPQCCWQVAGHGSFTVTTDRRLLFWNDGNHGAQQITAELPSNRLAWAGIEADSERRAWAVVGAKGESLHLVEIRLGDQPTCEVRKIEDSAHHFMTIVYHNDVLMLVRNDTVDVIELETGRRISQLKMPPHVSWMRDRFFATHPNGDCLALGFSGFGATLTPVFAAGFNDYSLVSMLEFGEAGPLGVTRSGAFMRFESNQLKNLDPQPKHDLPSPVRVAAVSADGRQVILHSQTGSREFAHIDLETGEHQRCPRPQSNLIPDFKPLKRQSLRVRIKAIGVNRKGELVLTTRNGAAIAVKLQQQLMVLASTIGAAEPATFVAPTWNSPLAIRLKVAELPGGGRAVLDGRGMLHLRSGDPVVPELTLVLQSRRVAGWAEGGRLWGSGYNTGADANISDHEAYHSLLLPMIDSFR